MAACRRLSYLTRKSRFNIICSSKVYSTHAEVKGDNIKPEDIVIPYRIRRGPTDILKALASTVSKDHTAAHYKYEDDPYFIPASNVTKRAFALSKESGKKAARYFLKNYPELFKCNTSVPHIKAFDPPPVYTEDNVSSCESLIECLTSFDVSNAVIVYDILKKKNIPINQAIKQDLLELLCFYNGSQSAEEDYYEERFYARSDDRQAEKWNSKGMAEKVFEEMEKDNASYSAMIAGAAKFRDTDKALLLLEEMRIKELIPTLEAYNSLISVVPRRMNTGESRWEFILSYLSSMAKDGIKPDLYTINACLEVMALSKSWKQSKSICKSILAEMKRLNIEPSLGTYQLVLTIFCSDSTSSEIGAIHEVLSKIEGKEFEIAHPLDVDFFSSTMSLCHRYAEDKELAYRLNRVLEYGQNSRLLGNALSESQYFKSFFKVLLATEDLHKFMEVYERYVPNTYIPEPSVMYTIMQNVHFTGLYTYLPKLCSDILMFEHTERENILSVALEAAGLMKHEKKIQDELLFIVPKIVEKLNIRIQSNRFNFSWTGQMLGDVMKTYMNGEDFEKTSEVMNQLITEEQSIVGFPGKDVLLSFCEMALQNNAYDQVKLCIRYATNGAYPEFKEELKKFVQQSFENEKIQTNQKDAVDSMLSAVSTEEKMDSSDSSDSSSDSSSSDEETEK